MHENWTLQIYAEESLAFKNCKTQQNEILALYSTTRCVSYTLKSCSACVYTYIYIMNLYTHVNFSWAKT